MVETWLSSSHVCSLLCKGWLNEFLQSLISTGSVPRTFHSAAALPGSSLARLQGIEGCFLPCKGQYQEAAFCAHVPGMLRWFFYKELLHEEARPSSLCLEQLQRRINLLQLGQSLSLIPDYLHAPAQLTKIRLPLSFEGTAAHVLPTEAAGLVLMTCTVCAAARPGQPLPLFVSGVQTASALKAPAPVSLSLQSPAQQQRSKSVLAIATAD